MNNSNKCFIQFNLIRWIYLIVVNYKYSIQLIVLYSIKYFAISYQKQWVDQAFCINLQKRDHLSNFLEELKFFCVQLFLINDQRDCFLKVAWFVDTNTILENKNAQNCINKRKENLKLKILGHK